MTAETADILRKARALVERGWCKHVFARRRSGHEVGYRSQGAARFCIEGAFSRAADDCNATWGGENKARNVLCATIPPDFRGKSLATFNDSHDTTQTDVLATFDRAIAAEEA